MRLAREALFQRNAVHDDVAAAGLQQDPGGTPLATSDRREAGQARAAAADGRGGCAVSHTVCSSLARCFCLSAARNCAACGCTGPAYTLSLRSIFRPSVL